MKKLNFRCDISRFFKLLKIIFLILMINLFWTNCKASELSTKKMISIDLQHVAIQDALYLIAKMTGQNLLIHSQVTGFVTLHLDHFPASEALDVILRSHSLVKIRQGSHFLIAPRNVLLHEEQEEQLLHDAITAASTLQMRIWQIRYAKAVDIFRMVQDDHSGALLSKRGFIHVDVRTNRLCVQDVTERLAAIDELIKKIDIPVRQVLIEARLASVDHDFERTLGLRFSVMPTDAAKQTNADMTIGHYGLAVAKLADGTLLDVQLAALENQGKGELISSPSLFTANQQTASIESGEEIPYQEVSRSGATGVAFKKAVLSLKVTPQILPDNQVLLQLQVNQDKPASRVVLGVPSITTRQISTNVLIKNGQTIVLGGIFESNRDNNEQGIPFLSKIPLVGLLFRQQNVAEHKRELLIFVTPKIIG